MFRRAAPNATASLFFSVVNDYCVAAGRDELLCLVDQLRLALGQLLGFFWTDAVVVEQDLLQVSLRHTMHSDQRPWW